MFGNTSFSFGNTSNAFGSNNNNNNNSMFGNNNNNNSLAFGNTGFGNSSRTTFGNSSFGNNSSNFSSSAFGNSTFVNNSSFNSNTSVFGSTSFGSSSAFGKTNSTSAFGSFGNTSNNTSAFGTSSFGNNNTSGFGSSGFGNSSSSAFGKTGFGNNTSSAFGGGMNSFGSNNNTSSFGNSFGSNNNSFGGGFGNNNTNENNGTGNPKYQQQVEKDGNSFSNVSFNSITAMPAYRNFSFEELRVKDYMLGKKGPSMGMGNSSVFGSSSTSAFGNMNNQRSAFGNTGFGSSMNNLNLGFGTSSFGNNNQNTSGFGGFGNNNNNNSFSTNNSNAFGNNRFGSSGFGNSGFGNNNNNNNNNGSVFGQSSFGSNAFNKPSTGAFGTSNSNAFGSTGFGSNNNSNNAFGSNSFSNQSTGFGFGNNNSTNNAFGQTTNTSAFSNGFKLNNNNNNTQTNGFFGQNNNNNQNSLFGNNSNNNNNNNNNSLFGQSNTTTNTSTQSNSLFGNNTNNSTGMNNTGFGFKSSSGFGTVNTATSNPTTATSSFGTTNSLFSKPNVSTPAQSTLQTTTPQTTFGSTNVSKPLTSNTSLFSSSNTTSKTTFGFNTASTTTTTTTTTTSLTTLTKTNTGPNTLTATPNNTTIKKTEQNQITVSKQEPQITPIIEKNKPLRKKTQSMIVPRKMSSKMKIREYNSEVQDTESSLSEDENSKSNDVTYKKKNNRISKDIQKLLDDFEKEAKENKFKEEVSFNEIKEQTEKLKIEDKKEQSNDTLSGKLTENRINSIRLFQEPDTFVNESDTNDNDDKEKSVKINEESIHSKGSVNKRLSSRRISMNTEYEVNPPISQLLKMTDEELCNVKNLEVYVKNVGSLKFLQPVDLLSACNGKKRENIPYIFGNIIIIQPKSCTVYPDDRVKPEVGQGLNQPAIIELYSCWAKDKSTGKPILDPSLPSYKKHLIHLKNIKDTEFIDYEALQGKWTFKVEHFTRYGLFTDDDDEDDDLEKILINNKKDLIIKKKINGNINRGYGLISTDDDSSENDVNNLNVVLNQQNNKTLVVTEVLSEDDIEQKNKLDSMKYCFNTMENAKKLQVMNVSIFGSLNNGRKHYSLKPINYSEDIIPLNKSRMNKRIEKLKKLRLINKSDVDSIKSTTKVDAKTLNNFKKNFEEDKKLIKNSISHDTPVFSLKPKTENQSNTEKELSNLSNISTEDLDKLDIIQNNLESIPFYKNSIFHEYFDKYKNNQVLNSLVFYFLKSRGFRVGWGQNNTIAIPSVNSSNNNKIQLGAVDVCKINFDPDRANHVILLNSILKFTKIEHDKNKLNENSGRVITNPYIVREKSNKIFTNLINSINSNTFNKNEILMWKLCQILFDNNEINELEECEDILSKEQKQYIIAMQKKQNIGKWLKESLTDTINHSLEVIRAKLENIKMSEEEGENSQKAKELIIKLIFIHLTGNNNRNACKEALNYKENRLALLISQQASCNEDVTDKKVIARGVPGSGKTDNYYMDMIKSQVNIWNDGDRDDNEENDLKSVMKILSGQIEVSLLKDLVDWKQVLGLIFWFKNGGSLSFSEALEHFDSLMESLESDRSINPSLFKYKEDIIYYLFKYYVQRDYSRSKILLPKNNSNSKLDYRISWLLNQLLPQGDKERNEREEEKLNNKLTYSYIFQLESIGLWEWACFVAMHIKDSSGREIMIRRLLVQHFPLNSNDDGVSTINYIVSRHPEIKYIRGTLNNQNNIDYWHFLVDNLQIPKIWIYDAKRIKAKYNGDLLREICYTIDCEKYEEAHRLITEDLASDLIIQHKYDLLYDILDNLKQKRSTIENANDKMKNWELNGGLYLDFIEFNDIFTTHKSIDKQLHDYQSNIFDLEETSASVGNSTHLLNSNVDKADIDDNLKNTSQLLNRIYDKKKEMSRNKPNHYEKIMQGLEIMEEILMTAYYAYNELKVEKRSLDTQKGVQEAREDAMEADDGSLLEFDHQAQNYQLLSETSLTDTKREQMIDQLTDQWFNTILDL